MGVVDEPPETALDLAAAEDDLSADTPLDKCAAKAEAKANALFPSDGKSNRGGSRYRGKSNVPRDRTVPQMLRESEVGFAIKRAAFERLLKEVVQEIHLKDRAFPASQKMTMGARVVAQYACEEFVSSLYSDAGVYARHAGRAETVSRKDLCLARDIRRRRLLEQRREDAEANYKKSLHAKHQSRFVKTAA